MTMSTTYSVCSILPSTSSRVNRHLPRHIQFLVRRTKLLSSTPLRVVKELIEAGTGEKEEIRTDGDGVALERKEENDLLDLGKVEEVVKEKKQKKKKVEEEATGDDQFKYQNGREVCDVTFI
jgi:hypothetical protein